MMALQVTNYTLVTGAIIVTVVFLLGWYILGQWVAANRDPDVPPPVELRLSGFERAWLSVSLAVVILLAVVTLWRVDH